MTVSNPNENIGILCIGVPTIGVPKVRYPNVFGNPTLDTERIETIDKPWLLWESGAAMLWEDGTEIELEQQKIRIWVRE